MHFVSWQHLVGQICLLATNCFTNGENNGTSNLFAVAAAKMPFKIFVIKAPHPLLIFQAISVHVPSFPSPWIRPLPSPQTSPHSSRHFFILTSYSSCSLLYYRSLLLIRLKSFLAFFLSFFRLNHENIQAVLTIEEYRDQELFGSIHTYITFKLLPSVGGVVKITKPKHSNTLIWGVDQCCYYR